MRVIREKAKGRFYILLNLTEIRKSGLGICLVNNIFNSDNSHL